MRLPKVTRFLFLRGLRKHYVFIEHGDCPKRHHEALLNAWYAECKTLQRPCVFATQVGQRHCTIQVDFLPWKCFYTYDHKRAISLLEEYLHKQESLGDMRALLGGDSWWFYEVKLVHVRALLEWFVHTFFPALEQPLQRKEQMSIRLYKDGDSMAIETDCDDEGTFVRQFCSLMSSLVASETYANDWEACFLGYLPHFVEICNAYRGYKTAQVQTRTVYVAGVIPPTNAAHAIDNRFCAINGAAMRSSVIG
jgi:hypothetical protein